MQESIRSKDELRLHILLKNVIDPFKMPIRKSLYIAFVEGIFMLIADSLRDDLILCSKTLVFPISQAEFKPKFRENFIEAEVPIISNRGDFSLRIRRNKLSENGFSIILLWKDGENKWRVIVRYNSSHAHTNKIENQRIEGFHRHKITEVYQRSGIKEEGFAELTDTYNTETEALNQLLSDCNISYPRDSMNFYFKRGNGR